MVNPENKPCLVQAGQGFSVKYKEKFLYSKYNPEKNILTLIENFSILPDTLILCFSPLLGYGLKKLDEKLPGNCRLIGIELDQELYSLSKTELDKLKPLSSPFYFLSPEEAAAFPKTLNESFNGEYKRVIKIDFSAGTQFNKTFYDNLFIVCQNIISQFWKNRITLVKFGRKFSTNLFKNLKILSESKPFFTVTKPILIVGAGESALKTLENIKEQQNDFFILAVDASLQALNALKIRADAVICEESQTIISGCFKGSKNNYDSLFLSLTSSNAAAKINPQKNIFYTSLFTNALFIKNLIALKIIGNPVQPLGSVGLSAVQIALKIRKNNSVPVFITGMDFSYSAGNSHIKSSFHENARRKISTKIKPFTEFSGSFTSERIAKTGKNEKIVYTNQTLLNYAELFKDRFSGTKNLFDLGKTGIDLGIPVSENPLTEENNGSCTQENGVQLHADFTREELCEKVKKYLTGEKKALLELRGILTGEIQLSEAERSKRIMEIIKPREYLYLHFPDGYKVNLSLGFLKRVRTEIDYFLKIISD